MMGEDGSAHAWMPKFLHRSMKSPDDPTRSRSIDENTTLIYKSSDGLAEAGNSESGESDDGEGGAKQTTKQLLKESVIILKGSIPMIVAYALQNSLQTVSVLIVGRSSPEDLATAAFSYMFATSTGWLLGLGGSTALDTLCSSTYTGGKNPHGLGILLQRAFIVLGLFYIPVVILWIFSEPVFRALGQDAQLSRDSARFLQCLIPGGLGYIYFECLKKYLQAQGIARPGTYVLLISSPANAGLNFLFIHTFRMGLIGAPVATGISYWLSFLLLLVYARFIKGWECWGGWSKKCFRNMGVFSRLAIMGTFSVGTEWWAFEIVALAAGKLGTIPLAAQSVIMTSDQLMNTIPFGLGVATSARVGNLLGARNAREASRAANTAAWLGIILGAVVLTILMGTKNSFAKIYNNDADVVKLTAEVIPFVALFQIADGLNGSCGGSLRGMGRQHIAAAVNIASYYFGALPLGIYLAFHGWGLKGLWAGQCIALYLVGALQWAIVAFSDWDYQVKKAFERMDE